jgi:hypothetical protein
VKVAKSDYEMSAISNKYVRSVGLIPKGYIYRAVRMSIYIVQAASNCSVNHAEYKVMGYYDLQLFLYRVNP